MNSMLKIVVTGSADDTATRERVMHRAGTLAACSRLADAVDVGWRPAQADVVRSSP